MALGHQKYINVCVFRLNTWCVQFYESGIAIECVLCIWFAHINIIFTMICSNAFAWPIVYIGRQPACVWVCVFLWRVPPCVDSRWALAECLILCPLYDVFGLFDRVVKAEPNPRRVSTKENQDVLYICINVFLYMPLVWWWPPSGSHALTSRIKCAMSIHSDDWLLVFCIESFS